MSEALKASRARMMDQVSHARTVSILSGQNDLKTADSGLGASGKRQAEDITPDEEAPSCAACAKKQRVIKEQETSIQTRNGIIAAYRAAHGSRVREDRLGDRVGSKNPGGGRRRGRGGRGRADRGRGRGRGGGANEGDRRGAGADGANDEG